MEKKYLQYEIAKQKGFYGVYFNSRFLIDVDSFKAAKEFVDCRVSDRLTLLLCAEFGAMSDRALTSIDDMLAYKELDPNLGWMFYEISQEANTPFQLEIVQSICKIIPHTMAFEIGYSEAQESLSLQSKEKESQAYIDNQAQHHKNLTSELEEERNRFANSALELMPSNIDLSSYDDISSLPLKVRQSLVKMEEANVRLLDDDECIDGRTSGHHREIKDILLCAANDKPIGECGADIYMSDEGVFNFDLIDHISGFAEKHATDNGLAHFIRTLKDCVEQIRSDSASLPISFETFEGRVKCKIKPFVKPDSYIVIEGGYIRLFDLNDEVLYSSHSSLLFSDIRHFYFTDSEAGSDTNSFYSHVRDSIPSFHPELFTSYKGAKGYAKTIKGWAINSLEDHFAFVEDMILNDCDSHENKQKRLEELVRKILYRYIKEDRALRDLPLFCIHQVSGFAAKTACKNKQRGVKAAVYYGAELLRSYCHQRLIKRKECWWECESDFAEYVEGHKSI